MALLADITSGSSPVSGVMFADAVSFFVALVIIGITALFNWIKSRKEQTDWSEVQKPREQGRGTAPAPASRPQPKKLDWEEELRKMLEEAPPTPAAPPPLPKPAPAPVPKPAAPMPMPPVQRPAPAMGVPKVFTETKTYKAHCDHCGAHIEFASNMMGDTILCPQCYKRTALLPYEETKLEKLMHQTELTVLQESASAYKRAEHLDSAVAARMTEITSKPVELTKVQAFKEKSAEVQQVVSLLRQPRTARQVILASVILGPSKAMEP